jgi:subtilisin family serine protease
MSACLLLLVATGCGGKAELPRYPQGPADVFRSRGPAESKLGFKLQALYAQCIKARGAGERRGIFSEGQLQNWFGIDPKDDDPSVALAIELREGADIATLSKAGADVHAQVGSAVYVTIPVRGLQRLNVDPAVKSIALMNTLVVPQLPASPKSFAKRPSARSVGSFDKQGLTGKGVIVIVVDTGIDWRHKDFVKPDGTSRILHLYDMYDESYASSGGKIGSAPPVVVKKKPMGTLYTQAQINAALSGKGVVNSRDRVGHGTACAGTAAGDGRAAGEGPPGTYAGVAPEADLIAIQAAQPKGGFAPGVYAPAVAWAVEKAKELGKPCVVNLSLGGHLSAHDGTEPGEKLLDALSGPGKPGVAICVASGNEGQLSLHAAGRFGPAREGQLDTDSPEIELFVTEKTILTAYFKSVDHWGLAVAGLEKFLVDKNRRPQVLYIYTDEEKVYWNSSRNYPASDRNAYVKNNVAVQFVKGRDDRVVLVLPVGRYVVWGFGADEHVKEGSFSLYLPSGRGASFGRGTVKRQMVGSPGNSTQAITVGSYDFRASWLNRQGERTGYNLVVGDRSGYTNPGFRRDGVIKPDITAPGRYTISSMAVGSDMAKVKKHIIQTGRHLAWSGTSASTPFTAGVIALMLQKNPNLDAHQIRKILRETATEDRFTGKVPNIFWGYGKLNPAAAIKKTPAP